MKLRFRRRAPATPVSPSLDRHREYVGGLWDEIGRLQFEFLVAEGLQPSHVFLDVAGGALRGGVHFVRYLEPGNYLGIDKEQDLLDRGVELELGRETFAEKRPELVVSDRFEFTRFSKAPTTGTSRTPASEWRSSAARRGGSRRRSATGAIRAGS